MPPRWLTGPEAESSAGPEVVELAASAGLFLDPWQQQVLDVALRERPDGRWAAFEVGLIVPRQNGKGSILEAVELAALFLFGERLILHSAHEFKTAAEAFLRILHLIESTPDLERLVGKVTRAHGEEGIQLKTGQRLRFVARSGGSGRGFTGDRVILDEAYNLPGRALSALMPTMSARPNPQLWYTSSAPLVGDESTALRRLCKRGREGAERLAYLEWSADSASLHDDREAWEAANPSIGIRIQPEFIEAERGAMEPADFARERLGIWFDDDDRERVIDPKLWAACEDLRSQIDGRLSFGFDVSPDRSTASICVAGKRADGLTHLEVVETGSGTAWLVPRLVELKVKWSGCSFVCDPKGPVGSLLTEAEQAGLTVRQATFADHVKACGSLYDDVLNRKVRHIGQPALNAAIDGAGRRIVTDAWLWSRTHSAADISPLVAATLAKWDAETAVPSVPLVSWR